MKLNIIIFYDSLLGAFCNPAFTDREPDIEAKSLDRFIRSKGQNYAKYLNKLMYHYGIFDDESGKMDILPVPTLLLDTNKNYYKEVKKRESVCSPNKA